MNAFIAGVQTNGKGIVIDGFFFARLYKIPCQLISSVPREEEDSTREMMMMVVTYLQVLDISDDTHWQDVEDGVQVHVLQTRHGDQLVECSISASEEAGNAQSKQSAQPKDPRLASLLALCALDALSQLVEFLLGHDAIRISARFLGRRRGTLLARTAG